MRSRLRPILNIATLLSICTTFGANVLAAQPPASPAALSQPSATPPPATAPQSQVEGGVSLGGTEASTTSTATPPVAKVTSEVPITPDVAAPPVPFDDGTASAPTREPRASGFRKWRPEHGMVELGIYGGALWLHSKHQFFGGAENNEFQRWRKFPAILPEIGLRLGYYPASFLGIEAEGSVLPTNAKATVGGKEAATLIWSGRGHLVLQLPLANLVPFVLGGVGALGVHSPDGSGTDADLAAHFGGGLKLYLNRYVALRLDARDVLAPRRNSGSKLKNHNFEALAGISFTFGRDAEPAPLPAPLPPPPPPPADTDGDGIFDPSDNCPQVPELVNAIDDLDGCPETDRDGDGFWDFPAQDTCPDLAGITPDGCPPKDTDGDGLLDNVDQCPEQAETKNGHQDDDGCPDEVPKDEVAKFSGSIEGIQFETGKATITQESHATLDRVVELLKKYPTLKLEVSGHTDSVGNNNKNLKLSQDRADAVKAYIAGAGVDAVRLTTRGAGEAEPIADNRKKAGRAKNRRIEFKISEQ